jgi:uncharacterized protein YutE (UPF0331/DUF86 family)
MRPISSSDAIAKADATRVTTFRSLMEQVARLAYANKDYLLFFRGQSTDYKNKAGASSFYPSIYRGERLTQVELEMRFEILAAASKRLYEAFERDKIEGAHEVRRRKHIQWSILQHYEVCATPLLDFTQSVRVASSFAMNDAGSEDPYVFAFGLPYVTNRVSVNSEHDLVNVRLLSICPPDALRPYFQEGYLVGTDEITSDYVSKDELDFNGRLVAKYQIRRGASFWGKGFDPIPHRALYPSSDKILALCEKIEREVGTEVEPSQLGRFLQAWVNVEALLLTLARLRQEKVYSAVQALRILANSKVVPSDVLVRLNSLRRTRNMAVHGHGSFSSDSLRHAVKDAQDLYDILKKIETENRPPLS